MSWEASGFVKKMVACPDGAPLSRGQKLLLLVLADYHDSKKQCAWPSVRTLADDALTSLATAKRDLAYLEEHLAFTRGRAGEGRGEDKAYRYRFVGLDVTIEAARKLQKKSSEGAQDEPFFSPDKKGSEGGHKGFNGNTEKGSERVHGGDCNKEEPISQKLKPVSNKQHAASGAMNVEKLGTEEGRVALRAWLEVKHQLQGQLQADEWAKWVRPAMLLKLMPGKLFLIALPNNSAIVMLARSRRRLLHEYASLYGFGIAGFTGYPDEFTRDRLRDEYPQFYEQMYGVHSRESFSSRNAGVQ